MKSILKDLKSTAQYFEDEMRRMRLLKLRKS